MSHISDLPVEILVEILSYVVPVEATFRLAQPLHPRGRPGYRQLRGSFERGLNRHVDERHAFRLSRVNRMFHSHVADILYGQNTFHVQVGKFFKDALDARNGALVDGLSIIPDVGVRRLRSLIIKIHGDHGSDADFKQVRLALERFVTRLGCDYALQHLRVLIGGPPSRGDRRAEPMLLWRQPAHILEPVAQLWGIKEVSIRGLDEAYNRRLESVMTMAKEAHSDLKVKSRKIGR